MPSFPLVFGVDTFGELAFDHDGHALTQAETIRRVVDEGVLADQVGLEFFGIGEHHTNDWPMPAGDVVLAAIASRTRQIHLGSAVLVLSSDDPVRVFQRYSTLHALSGGRAEVILGRGSSIESFPLFGYDLADYETLFEEKTQLFAASLDRFGHPPRPVGVHAPGHIADTDEQARDELWPHYRDVLTRVGRQRGWPPPTKEQFLRETGPDGAWHVGSAETVARKIAANLPALGASRFDLKYGMVGLPHDTIMRTIELYGAKVVPLARELLADADPVPDPAA